MLRKKIPSALDHELIRGFGHLKFSRARITAPDDPLVILGNPHIVKFFMCFSLTFAMEIQNFAHSLLLVFRLNARITAAGDTYLSFTTIILKKPPGHQKKTGQSGQLYSAKIAGLKVVAE